MVALIKLGKWENWFGTEGEALSFRLLGSEWDESHLTPVNLAWKAEIKRKQQP